MNPADRVRIQHMLESARDAISFLNGKTREDLFSDRMLRLSVERAVEIVGEAAVKVSVDFRSAHPDIPWTDMMGMRNRLIHAYFDVNPNIIWSTATSDLPALVARLELLLAASG